MSRCRAAAVLLTLLVAGCGSDDGGGSTDDGGPGLSKDVLTRAGDDACAFDEEFRNAVAVAGFEGEVGEYPAGFDQVILHVGDQDHADSADSTDLYDVRGAYQICRWSIGEEYIAEAYLYWFAPTADRTALEDAEAWQYALADVSSGAAGPAQVDVDAPVPVPADGQVAAVSAVRASGGEGASAAVAITVDGYRPDPAAAPRSLTSRNLSGPLPPQDQVVDLVGAVAEQLSR